jgi:hypothetical protein
MLELGAKSTAPPPAAPARIDGLYREITLRGGDAPASRRIPTSTPPASSPSSSNPPSPTRTLSDCSSSAAPTRVS